MEPHSAPPKKVIYNFVDNSENQSKKRDGEKRHSPLGIPYREKGQREEIGWDSCRTNHRARAGASRACARRGLKRIVAAVVERALVVFRGTRGPGMTSESVWARIAWRIGAENFERAIEEKLSENRADGKPKNLAAAFQAFLDRRYPRPTKGGAE